MSFKIAENTGTCVGSLQELSNPFSRYGMALLPVAIIIAVRFLSEIYYVQICNDILLAFCLALGMALIFGHAGILDLGYIAFVAVGAYAYGFLSLVCGWSFWVSLPVCGGLAAIFSVIIGLPTLRAQGDYLAIVTLGFGEIVRTILQRSEGLTGGARGIVGMPHAVIFGVVLASPEQYFWLLIAITVVLTSAYLSFSTSRIERFWRTVRDNPQLASTSGISRRSTLLVAFACGASIAGLTGAVFGARTGFLSPDSFTLFDSIYVLVYVVVVGQVYGDKSRSWISSRALYAPMLFGTVSAFIVLGEIARPFLLLKPTIVGTAILGAMLVRHNLNRMPGQGGSTADTTSDSSRSGIYTADNAAAFDFDAFAFHCQQFLAHHTDRCLDVRLTGVIAGVEIVKDVRFRALASLSKQTPEGSLSAPTGFSQVAQDSPVVTGIIGVIGLNGAGKTTLLRGLLNLVATCGSVTLRWKDRRSLGVSAVALLRPGRVWKSVYYHRSCDEICRQGLIGLSFQTPEVVQMTVAEYLTTALLAGMSNYELCELGGGLRVARLTKLPLAGFGLAAICRAHLARGAGRNKVILPYLSALGLDFIKDSWLPTLPLYYKRLVELTKLLILRPEYILLDEIMAGLDAHEKEQLKRVVRVLNRECGLGVLMIEHDLEAMRSVADSIILMDQGEMVVAGPTEEVLASARFRKLYEGI